MSDALHVFLDVLWSQPTGKRFACVYSANRSGTKLTGPISKFFAWPQEADTIARFIREQDQAGREVYTCAHLLTAQRRLKENAAPIATLWADAEDADLSKGPTPTLVVESSPGRTHAYWRLSDWIEPTRAEALNKRLALLIGADPSGYDLTQLLRPPDTHNHKFERAVEGTPPAVRAVRWGSKRIYDPAELEAMLPTSPEPVETQTPIDSSEPPVRLAGVALKRWLGEPKTLARFTDRDGKVDRSKVLYTIGQDLARAGATCSAIVVALKVRDVALGFQKYSNRCSDDAYLNIAKKALATPQMPGSGAHDAGEANAQPQGVDDVLGWTLTPASVIAARGVPEIEWDIEGLLERFSGPTLLFGPTESLKSWIALHAAVCSVTGDLFLGKFPVRLRQTAIYLNFDAGARAFDRRVALMGAGLENLLIASPSSFDSDALRLVSAQYPEAFIVIDCLSDVYRPDPQVEQGTAMRVWFRDMRKLYEAGGHNGFIVDHTRRLKTGDSASSERYYGSAQKKATARSMWFVERLHQQGEGETAARARVTCEKLNEAEKFSAFIVDTTWSSASVALRYGGFASEAIERGDAATRHAEIIEPYLSGVGGGLSVSQIIKQTGLSESRVRAALRMPGFTYRGTTKDRRYMLSIDANTGDLNDAADNPILLSPPRNYKDQD